MVQAIKMQHKIDPKAEMMAEVGADLKGLRLFHNQILVGIYERPETTAGGIILPGQTRKEDQYQGKVGLVLAKGPLAFVDDARNEFHGQNVEVGDWIAFRASDGWQLTIGKKLCRMLQDLDIKIQADTPDTVF